MSLAKKNDSDDIPSGELVVNGTTAAEFFSSAKREFTNGGKLTEDGKKMLNVWNYGRQRNVLLIMTLVFAAVAMIAIIMAIVARRRNKQIQQPIR